MTKEQALAMASARLRLQGGGAPQPSAAEPAMSTQPGIMGDAQRMSTTLGAGDADRRAATMEAISNIPSSAGKFAGGIYQAVSHPIDTASNLWDVGAGALKNITPKPIADAIDKFDPNPQSADRAVATADAAGQMFKDRYGGIENIKNTLKTDPVGAAADASALLGVGGGIASKFPQGQQLASSLRNASSAINPVNAAIEVGKVPIKAAGTLGKEVLGLTTGVGPENIANALKAGYKGDSTFMDNLTGKVPMSDVLDKAQQNLANIQQKNSALYKSGMVDVTKDKSILNFSAIDDAVKEASNLGKFKGQVKNAKVVGAVEEIRNMVDEWKNLEPAQYHTPEGLDALKQSINGVLETIPYEQKTARMAAGNVYAAIKKTISEQAPTYADVMKNYSEGADLLSEMRKTLSLNPRASVDTAIRKLQSLTRNNVNTNYGNRLDLAKALQEQGGNDLMPALSGQAMSSFAPRGLVGRAGALATLGSAVHNPLALALLPAESPGVVGAGLYSAGRIAKGVSKLQPPGGTSNLANALYQAGRLPQ